MALPGSDSGGDQKSAGWEAGANRYPSIGPLYSLVAWLVQWACANLRSQPIRWAPNDVRLVHYAALIIIKCNISGTIIIWLLTWSIPGSGVISIINLEWATSLVLA